MGVVRAQGMEQDIAPAMSLLCAENLDDPGVRIGRDTESSRE